MLGSTRLPSQRSFQGSGRARMHKGPVLPLKPFAMLEPPYIDSQHVLNELEVFYPESSVLPGPASWQAFLTCSAGAVAVQFRRFCTEAAHSVTWHAQQNQRCLTSQHKVEAIVFATGDESVLGRCACMQTAHSSAMRPNTRAPHVVHVTLADSRMTSSRLMDLMSGLQSAMFDFLGTRACTSKVCNTLHHAMDHVMATWPAGPAGLEPDLQRMLQHSAPQPVYSVAKNVVAVAGGNLVVAMADPSSARRCIKEDDFLSNPWHVDGQSTALTRLSSSIAPHQSVLLVSQRAGSVDCICQADNDRKKHMREMTLVSGVPAAQLACTMHCVLQECLSEVGEVSNLRYIAKQATLTEDLCLKAERDEAANTIRQMVMGDRAVRNIKAKLWHPSGRLVRKMIMSR